MCQLEPALSWLKAKLSHLWKFSQLTSAGSQLAEPRQHYVRVVVVVIEVDVEAQHHHVISLHLLAE